jgi:aromatic-L-amino-acid decarboxylase
MSSRTPFWGANHPNFSDRGLPLSRSARALKIWMSVQTFGMAAFRQAVSQGMELAARADAYVRESAMLETLNPASLGIVCFRVNPAGRDLDEETLEKVNRNVLARVFWEDRALISSITLAKKLSLRLCIINHNTTWDDVRETLEATERFGAEALQDR